MTVPEWREKAAADRPPMNDAQIAAIRPVLAPVIPHMLAAPADETGAAPAETARNPKEGP